MTQAAVPGTPGLLRSLNDRTVLGLLIDHGPLTRARIGELSGLSKPTASQVVSRLESLTLITEVGQDTTRRGPTAAVYGVRADGALGFAVDLLPYKARGELIDAAGAVRASVECRLPRSAGERSPVSDVRTALEAACAEAALAPKDVSSVVVGLQGAVDPATDRLSFTGTIPGWPRRGPQAALADGLGVTARIENDVNLAAVAERTDGAGSGTDGFALLWIGEGLGLAVDNDGTLHRGASGGAGEIGYLPVSGPAVAVEPAARDLTDLIGGVAVARLLRGSGYRGRTLDDLLGELAGHPSDTALDLLAERIAAGLIPVLAVLDPARVILGGPTAAAGGVALADRVHAAVKRTSRWSTAIVPTGVPQRAVLAGARTVARSIVRQQLLDLL